MAQAVEDVIAELTRVIDAAKAVSGALDSSFRYRLLAAIQRHAPSNSPLRAKAQQVSDWHPSKASYELTQIAIALRDDFRDGYLHSFEGRIQEAVFDDLLELAAHIDENLHHPATAAVIAGAVLEQHLRKLSEKLNISATDAKGRPLKFEVLGHELVKHPDGFSESQRKTLSGWYAQRTEGAHGHFENVIAADVPSIIDGVRAFISRHPA